VTLDAKALASKGLTYHDALALKRDGKEIDLVSPVANEDMTIRYREIEKPRSIMGVTPAYSPMNDFHAVHRPLHHRQRPDHRLTVVVLGHRPAGSSSAARNGSREDLDHHGTGYLVVGVMEEKYFSFDHKHNVMRWMNRQNLYPPSPPS